MHSSKVDNTRWLAWDLQMGRPRQKTRRCIGRRHLLTGKRWLAQWRWTALKRVLHRLESFCTFPVLWHVNDMRIVLRDVRCERDAWTYWRETCTRMPQFELSPGSLLQNAMFWGLVLQRGLIALQKHLQNDLCFNALERFTCWDLLCFAMQIAASFSIFYHFLRFPTL